MAIQSQPQFQRNTSELLPLFEELLPRYCIETFIKMTQKHYYQRFFTPIVLLWCFIYQRLHQDHSCDAVVSHLASGSLDYFDNPQRKPLSQRMESSNTAAYCKGRNRFPLSVLQDALQHTVKTMHQWLGPTGQWLGHHVGLLDGSTLLARPAPLVVAHYGCHSNQHGQSYWVVIRLLVAFCLHSGAVLFLAHSPLFLSEQVLCVELFARALSNSVYIGDSNFGIFSVAQASRHYGVWLIVRLNRSRAHALAKRTLLPGSDIAVQWNHSRCDQLHPHMSTLSIEGRLIFVRIQHPGYRPVELYLFTTLRDASVYTKDELVKLYGFRWHAELDLRYVKDTLDLKLLSSKSPEMIAKELFAGMLAYNIIRGFMVKSAQESGQSPLRLSFSKCLRRILCFLVRLRPTDSGEYVIQRMQVLVKKLSECKLPVRAYIRVEPRAIWKYPNPYQILKGSRSEARLCLTKQLKKTSKIP